VFHEHIRSVSARFARNFLAIELYIIPVRCLGINFTALKRRFSLFGACVKAFSFFCRSNLAAAAISSSNCNFSRLEAGSETKK
jgi:hypothetical protein